MLAYILMKLLLIGLMLYIFVYLPVQALDAVVMPQIESLSRTYQSAEQTAAAIANGQ